MKVLVAYDGTLQAQDALRYGMEKVRDKGGELVALHIFDSGLFAGYDAVPYARELAQREAHAHIENAKKIIKEAGSGINASLYSGEGDPEEAVLEFARTENVDILLCPPKYKSIIRTFKKLMDGRGRKTSESLIIDETMKVELKKTAVEIRAN